MQGVLAEIKEVEIALDSITDNEILIEIRVRLSDLLDRLDDKLDLRLIGERRNESTLTHSQVTQELRADGLL